MLPPRLFIGFQLLTLAYTAQSLVMLTANSEDVKKLARKFVSESLADKIAEFLAISSLKAAEPVSAENEDEFHRDNAIDDNISDDIDTNEGFELRNRDVQNNAIRTIKDLNTPPLRLSKIESTRQLEPKNWQEESHETQIKTKRPRRINMKHLKTNKEMYLPANTDNLNKETQNRDRLAPFLEPKKALLYPHEIKLERNKHFITGDSYHHQHKGNIEPIEKKTDIIERQTQTTRKNIKSVHRNKPRQFFSTRLPQPFKQNSAFKQQTPDQANNFKKDHQSKFEDTVIDKKPDDFNDNMQDNKAEVKQGETSHVSFIRDPMAYYNEEPIYETEIKPQYTQQLKRLSTVNLQRIRKELMQQKQIQKSKSNQFKEPVIKVKKWHNSGRNKPQIRDRDHHRQQPILYFPNKPKLQTENEQSHYEFVDTETLQKQTKRNKQFYHINNDNSQSDVKDEQPDNQYKIHEQTHILEPKLEEDKHTKEETVPAYNNAKNKQIQNGNTQSSIIAPFLTTKQTKAAEILHDMKEIQEQKTEILSYINSPNHLQESNQINVTTAKAENYRGTKSILYHGDHKVTEDMILKEGNEFDARKENYNEMDAKITSPTKVVATSGKIKLSEPNDKNNEKLWEQIEQMNEKATPKKFGLF